MVELMVISAEMTCCETVVVHTCSKGSYEKSVDCVEGVELIVLQQCLCIQFSILIRLPV